MKHRERVEMALNHKKPDRCPMQISFTPEFASRLRKDMGFEENTIHNPFGNENIYDLELSLGIDMLLPWVGWSGSYYQGDNYTDEWGVHWRAVEYKTKYGTGKYTEMVKHPLENANDIESYCAPDPKRPELYLETEEIIKNYKNEYYIVGVVVTTIFESAWALRGLEQLLVDFVINPDIAEMVLEIPFRYHLEAAKKMVELGVDMVWVGDDVGSQNAMLISPSIWRKYLKPRYAKIFSSLKRINPNLKIAYHSDGNILPIIPELIEIGLDVLNPIQPASMDPYEIKKKYGKNLSFWGTIDEQNTLPFGNPEDVKKEVKERITEVGRDGGFIIGPTHHVQLDTPLENFWAMVNTITK